MSEYLKYGDEGSLTDIVRRKPDGDHTEECPVCHGHGKWNLSLDTSGRGRHSQAHCNQCNGWGYVRPGSADAKCVHEMDSGTNIGKCLTRYTCKKCGHRRDVDSSG